MDVVEWWEERDEGCTRVEQALPDGAPTTVGVLGGSCALSALATGPDGSVLVLSGRDTVDRLVAGVSESLPPAPAWGRSVAFSAEGEALLLTAVDGASRGDDGADFDVRTWALRDDAWVEVEQGVEVLRSVRAVVGGAVWTARRPGSTFDAWTLEDTPGFAVVDAADVQVPKRLAVDGVLLWGTAAAGSVRFAVRYTMLGVPVPAGPVYAQRGRRWTRLDDRRFLETPASLQVGDGWALLSYEGFEPQLVSLATGRRQWSEEERSARTGARLASRP